MLADAVEFLIFMRMCYDTNRKGHQHAVKVRPKTGHEGPGAEWRYSSTISLTSALGEGRWLMSRPDRFTTGKKTHRVGDWVDTRAVWTDGENFAPTRIQSPDRSARSESLHLLSYPGFASTSWQIANDHVS